jgi:hypothetical protein
MHIQVEKHILFHYACKLAQHMKENRYISWTTYSSALVLKPKQLNSEPEHCFPPSESPLPSHKDL